MNLQNLVGSRVILTIRSIQYQDREILPRITRIGARDSFSIIAKVVDFDSLGIWIEKENYPVFNQETKKRETLLSHVLVKYDFITSIAAFPDLADDGLYAQHKIGFDNEEEK